MRRLFLLLLLVPLALQAQPLPPERASQAEVNAGVDNSKYVTPAALNAYGLQLPGTGTTGQQVTNIVRTLGLQTSNTYQGAFIGNLVGCSNYAGLTLIPTNPISITAQNGTNFIIGVSFTVTNPISVGASRPETNSLLIFGIGDGNTFTDSMTANSLYWWNSASVCYTNQHGCAVVFDSSGVTLNGGWYITNRLHNAGTGGGYICETTTGGSYFYPGAATFNDAASKPTVHSVCVTNYMVFRIIDGDIPILVPNKLP